MLMTATRRALALLVALGAGAATLPASGEDLLQIYREAQQNDPTLASARAAWVATQEKVPQAVAGMLPNVQATANANLNQFRSRLGSNPVVVIDQPFDSAGYTISASQPLFRYQNVVSVGQAREQVTQADYSLGSAQQDLIVRVAQAYFDVLLAQVNVELTDAQSAAVSEQLAQAKRNFEVGVSTITDTNEAQARYDNIVAQRIAAVNDLDNKRTALRAIIGRAPGDLKRLGPGFEPQLPDPNNVDYWVDRALHENFAVRVAQSNYDIAALEVERQRAGHYPTLDLVGSFGQSYATGAASTGATSGFDVRNRNALLGVQLAVPIYQGGIVNSRVREAIANQDKARQDLETNRRNALFLAQTGYAGVNSAAASIKAFEQALVSAQSAYESNRLGLEVGVRTTLDVLTVQQTVTQTRRDLAQAYFNYLMGVLRLKAAAGILTDADLEDLNRRLAG
jgi:outer membrane protein